MLVYVKGQYSRNSKAKTWDWFSLHCSPSCCGTVSSNKRTYKNLLHSVKLFSFFNTLCNLMGRITNEKRFSRARRRSWDSLLLFPTGPFSVRLEARALFEDNRVQDREQTLIFCPLSFSRGLRLSRGSIIVAKPSNSSNWVLCREPEFSID